MTTSKAPGAQADTEDRDESAPFFALGMTTALLGAALVTGTTSLRLIALGGVIAIVVVVALLTIKARRVDYGEDSPAPVWHELVGHALDERGRPFVFFATFLVFLWRAGTSPTGGSRERLSWLGPALAVAAGIVLLAAIASIVRRYWSAEGVERQVFLESTCIGFFVVVLAAGTYAALEVLAGAPRLPAWSIWVAGVGAWALASGIRGRRMG